MDYDSRAIQSTFLAVLYATILAAAGCDKHTSSGETVGEKIDRVIDKTNDKVDATKAKIGARADAASSAVADAASTVAQKAAQVGAIVDDSAITASIKADMLKDPGLAALRIDVNTVKGEVTLRGEAGSDVARQRAVVLASATAGVVKVNDEVTVRP